MSYKHGGFVLVAAFVKLSGPKMGVTFARDVPRCHGCRESLCQQGLGPAHVRRIQLRLEDASEKRWQRDDPRRDRRYKGRKGETAELSSDFVELFEIDPTGG